MRVLLVQFDLRNPSFPFGLACVAATLQQAGHQVFYTDLADAADPVQALITQVRQDNIHVIGVTLLTTNYGQFLRIFAKCAEIRHIPVIGGGVHAEIAPEQVLRDGFVRVAVRFEGEVVAAPLFQALENGDDLATVRGIAFLDGENRYVETVLPAEHADLNSVPRPAYELVNITRHPRYIHGKPFAMVFTSRGCPYRCAFCYRGPSGGKRLRFMSVDRVMEEVSYLHSRFGFEAFDFHDDLFTINRERVLEICHAFLNRGFRFSWICEARVNQIDFELLNVMKRAGCVGIYFGVESGHPYILEKMNKGITPAQIAQTFSLCRRLRIPTVAYFILGTPWDTEESFKTTLQVVKEIKPTVSVFFAARPFPRTALREAFIQHGMAIPQTYDDYAYFVEGEDNAGTRGETNRYQRQEAMIRRRCIHATRRALFYQLKDILSYPRLIAELIDLYGLRQFVVLALRRLGIFIKSA